MPKTDEQGRVLRKDGKVWQDGDGDDAIDWVSNEGVRVSVILEHLMGLPLAPEQCTILGELGPQAVQVPTGPAGMTVAAGSTTLQAERRAEGAVTPHARSRE